jgi:hypothetical protein
MNSMQLCSRILALILIARCPSLREFADALEILSRRLARSIFTQAIHVDIRLACVPNIRFRFLSIPLREISLVFHTIKTMQQIL